MQQDRVVTRDQIIEAYEKDLRKARWGARVVGALLGIARFLGYCGLTWATVVLLGGFVSNIQIADFNIVTILLLLEAGRLASAIFFSKVVRRALINLSQNPPSLKQVDIQSQVMWAFRVVSQILQVVFISPSIVLPIVRLRVLPHGPIAGVRTLLPSLKIFYIVVLTNAFIALSAMMCSSFLLYYLYDPVEQSIQMYYDEILLRAFDNGIVLADDFDFVHFAFTTLSRDLSRNVQPKVIQKNYGKLINYLYAHRQGVDEFRLRLDSDSSFVREAAICIAGFWANQRPLSSPVRLPPYVLTKLADNVGNGQVGWKAVNSLGELAKEDAINVFSARNSNGETIMNILTGLLDPKSSRSLVIVRALVTLQSVNCALEVTQDLENKLGNITDHSKRHRMRALAAFLLMKLGKLNPAEHKSWIVAINPLQDDYFWKDEFNMLNAVRKFVDLSEFLEKDLEGKTAASKKKFAIHS